jgi:lipopolysaccharide export system permease protein
MPLHRKYPRTPPPPRTSNSSGAKPARKVVVRTLNTYISKSFLVTFLATVVVFTFVLSIGGLFKLTDLVSKGIPWRPILTVFASGMPSALSFAIPISALTATLLVFGRLSADSEITAMKACGISLWRVMRWMLPVAFLMAAVCLYVNSELVPDAHFARRSAMASMSSQNPIDLLEEGRPIRDFEGLTVYVGRKRDDELEDIRIYDLRTDGQKREIKAKRGTVAVETNSNDIILALEDVTIDPFSFDRPVAAYCGKWTERIQNSGRKRSYRKKVKDMTLAELFHGIQTAVAETMEDANDVAKRRMVMSVEMHKRFSLSCSCIAFVFLGVPLGIRSHRKESSIGVALSLLLVFSFYLFIIVAEQLAKHPALHPDALTWMPVALSLVIGSILVQRMS